MSERSDRADEKAAAAAKLETPEVAKAKADAAAKVEAAKVAEEAAKAAVKKAQEDEAQAKKNLADAKSKSEGEYEVIGAIWMDNVLYQGTPDGEENPVVKMTGVDAARLVAAGNLRKK